MFSYNVKKSEVKFDTGELPVHYEQKNNALSYCIYAFGTGKMRCIMSNERDKKEGSSKK